MITVRLQILSIVIALSFTLTVFYLIKNDKLDLKYSIIWLFAGLVMIVLPLYPQTLVFASKLLNIMVPANTLFLVGSIFLICIVFSLTVALSRSSMRIKNLTQEVAILRNKVEKLNNHSMDPS